MIVGVEMATLCPRIGIHHDLLSTIVSERLLFAWQADRRARRINSICQCDVQTRRPAAFAQRRQTLRSRRRHYSNINNNFRHMLQAKSEAFDSQAV